MRGGTARGRWSTALALTLGLGAGGSLSGGCAEDEVKVSGTRGIPGGAKKASADNKARKAGGTSRASDEPDEVEEGPERPKVTLDEKSFSRRRDPFRTFVAAERPEPEPDSPRAARKVKLAQYGFEDLKLVIIVNSGRGIQPRAQFVGGDGRSGTVLQGEYFSSAEVLLAAVNRDYVEVEVVDEELATSLGLKRGERRPIFLRTD